MACLSCCSCLVPPFCDLPSLTVSITLVMARPIYRKKKISHSSGFSDGGNDSGEVKVSSVFTETPAMLVPSISPSVSVREAIQEVKMVQVFSSVLIGCKCGFSLSLRMHKYDTYVYCCNRTLPVLCTFIVFSAVHMYWIKFLLLGWGWTLNLGVYVQ